jgi:hypothetical protein
VTPGTAIRLLPGTYQSAFLGNVRGTLTAPIWIGGEPGEARPLLTGSTALQMSRAACVVLHDLEVGNTSLNGINCDDAGDYDDPEASRYLVFRDLFIHDTGPAGCNCDGLKLSGINDFVVVNCTITRSGGSTPGSGGSGIDMVGCHRGLITGCTLFDLSSSGVQAKGGTEEITIRGNTFKNAGLRALNIGGSTDFEFFRPPLSETGPNAESRRVIVTANVIEGGDAAVAFVGTVNSEVVNNTIVRPGRVIRILQETTSSPPYTFLECGDNVFANNIVYFNRAQVSQGRVINIGTDTRPSTIVFDSNLWYAFDQPANSAPPDGPGYGNIVHTRSISGQDPRFVDPSADYTLQAASPAIEHADSARAPRADRAGRCFATPPSIGAFEGRCAADFNDDGVQDFFDYLDFVQAFSTDDQSADIDGNGQVDFFDYLEFVALYGVECGG